MVNRVKVRILHFHSPPTVETFISRIYSIQIHRKHKTHGLYFRLLIWLHSHQIQEESFSFNVYSVPREIFTRFRRALAKFSRQGLV